MEIECKRWDGGEIQFADWRDSSCSTDSRLTVIIATLAGYAHAYEPIAHDGGRRRLGLAVA